MTQNFVHVDIAAGGQFYRLTLTKGVGSYTVSSQFAVASPNGWRHMDRYRRSYLAINVPENAGSRKVVEL